MRKPTKMGRPKKPDDKRLNVALHLRVTDDEAAAIERAAAPDPIGIWLRKVAVKAAKRKR